MSRRKPDARHPQRSPSKGGSDRREGPKSRADDTRKGDFKAGPKSSPRPGGKSGGKFGGKPGGKPGMDRKSAQTRAPRPGQDDRGDRPRRDDRQAYEPRREEYRQDDRRPQSRGPRDGAQRDSAARDSLHRDRPPRDQGFRDQPPRDQAPRDRASRDQGERPAAPRRDFRDRGHRGDLPTWLYGSHACLAALNNPDRYHRRLLLTREAREALADDLPANPQPEIFDKLRLDALLPPGAVHQGIALLTDPLEDPGVESLQQPESDGREIVLLLDHVTDPRNVGAILRSAAAFGARAVIVTDRHAPEATGALAKAASGGLEVVPLIRVTNLSRALDLLADYGFWRVGLEMDTDKTLAEAVHDIRRVALVLGAEDEGLRRLTREKCDFLAKLPMTGAVESLNVSAAAAVALYECARS